EAIKKVEVQVGDLDKQLQQLQHRAPNTFPSNTITNPKEECKAICVMMVEETPLKEERVEAEPKTTMITPPPPPRPKSPSGKPYPLSKFLEPSIHPHHAEATLQRSPSVVNSMPHSPSIAHYCDHPCHARATLRLHHSPSTTPGLPFSVVHA
ncbi:hypothetical protein PIB30_080311, partial [Stylosanthes scabra]|nr:hypothetical protein [Stylosanthes scabra]